MADNATTASQQSSVSKPGVSPSWTQSRGVTYGSAAVGIIAAVLLWTTLYASDPLAEQRERLAKKDQSTRDKIRENASVFATLDKAQQDKLRSVSKHMAAKSEIEWNKSSLGIELFEGWFASLPISDRDAIRSAGDTAARKQAVIELLDENEAAMAEQPGQGRGRGPFNLRIPASRFEELAVLLESAAGREPDSSRPPVMRVVELFASKLGGSSDRFANFRAIRELVGPSADEILGLLPARPPVDWSDDRKLMAAVGTVFESLDAEFQRQRRTRKITDAQIQAAFEARADDQDRLLSLSPSEFRSELTKYVIFDELRDEETTLSERELEGLLTFSSRLREMIRATASGRGGPPRGSEDWFRPGGGNRGPDGRGFGGGRGPGDRQFRGGGFPNGGRPDDRGRADDRGGPRDRPPRPPEGRRPE